MDDGAAASPSPFTDIVSPLIELGAAAAAAASKASVADAPLLPSDSANTGGGGGGDAAIPDAQRDADERHNIRLIPMPASKRRATEAKPNSAWDLRHYLVLYDDDTIYPQLGHFVPQAATYTVCRLTHRFPPFYADSEELYDWVTRLVGSYEAAPDFVRMEVPYPGASTTRVRIGLVDACIHANNSHKQFILAYLLALHKGNVPDAWDHTVRWLGGAEHDRWDDVADYYVNWVIPALEDRYQDADCTPPYDTVEAYNIPTPDPNEPTPLLNE